MNDWLPSAVSFRYFDEFCFGGRVQGLGVVHGHFGGGVAKVSLNDVEGHAGVEQVRGLGVPEVMGSGELEWLIVFVTDIGEIDQLAQLGAEDVAAIGALTVEVVMVSDEQVLRRRAFNLVPLKVVFEPAPLFGNDLDGLRVNEDCFGCSFDLGLLVSQFRDPLRSGVFRSGNRDQWIHVDHADFASAAAGG